MARALSCSCPPGVFELLYVEMHGSSTLLTASGLPKPGLRESPALLEMHAQIAELRHASVAEPALLQLVNHPRGTAMSPRNQAAAVAGPPGRSVRTSHLLLGKPGY